MVLGVVVAGATLRPAHAETSRVNGPGDCDGFFAQADVRAVLKLVPPFDPAFVYDAQGVKTGPGQWHCKYRVYGYPHGKKNEFIETFITMDLFKYPDQSRAVAWAKVVCATSASQACRLAERVLKTDDPLQRVKLTYRELGELGDVENLTGSFGSFRNVKGGQVVEQGNPAFLWEPDAAFGWAGSTVDVLLVQRQRLLAVTCVDATNKDNSRAAPCAKKAAKLAYLGLT